MSTGSTARQPRAAGWWVGALTVVIAVMTATLGYPAPISETGPTAYLPSDGFRAHFTGGSGALATEWAIGPTLRLAGSGPTHFSYWLLKAGLDLDTAVAARRSTVFSNASGQVVNREDVLMSIGADGVGTAVEARSWTDSRFYFPARLDLPNQLVAGKRWTSEGTAQVAGASSKIQETTYHADYRASAAPTHDEQVRRCIVITMTLRVGTATDAPESRTWCPGLGVISIAEPQVTWRADQANGSIATPLSGSFDWAGADHLQLSPHTINDASVPGAMTALPVTDPAILSDGTVVVVQRGSNDSLGLDLAAEPVVSSWRVRSGALPTATATFGDLTLIAGADRRLVAYDRYGRWIWQTELSDQTIVPPVRLGDSAVVATLDGSVTAIDVATGVVRWSKRLADSVRVAPQAFADRVVVADLSQHLTCFSADGTVVWSTPVNTSSVSIVGGANPVVISRTADTQTFAGYALSDGAQLWTQPTRLTFRSTISLDGLLVVRDASQTVGIDPTTGAVAWRWAQAQTYAGVGQGNRFFLLTDRALILLDDHGQQLKQWPVPVSSDSRLSVANGRVLVWLSRGSILMGEVK